MSTCRLCLEETELRNSHIVPEFLFSDLYNAEHKFMGVTGIGPKGWVNLQKGIREHLLCDGCEQLINDEYEKPFKAAWIDKPQFPSQWEIGTVMYGKFDYRAFKLFHLSILFRAGVSSLPTFAEVNDPQVIERMRLMVLSGEPGAFGEFPIIGCSVVLERTGAFAPIITRPEASSYKGLACYSMVYGGVQWWVSVSPHRNREFEAIGLQRDGTMPLIARPFSEVPIIQFAADALRRTDT